MTCVKQGPTKEKIINMIKHIELERLPDNQLDQT